MDIVNPIAARYGISFSTTVGSVVIYCDTAEIAGVNTEVVLRLSQLGAGTHVLVHELLHIMGRWHSFRPNEVSYT